MRAFSDCAFSFCTSFSLSFSFFLRIKYKTWGFTHKSATIFLQSEKQNENEEAAVRALEPSKSRSMRVGTGEYGFTPLRKLQFKEGKDYAVYSAYGQQNVSVDWKGETPVFYEIDPSALHPDMRYQGNYDPSEYILVMGANYVTYSKLKGRSQLIYSVTTPVYMPRKKISGAFIDWDPKDLKKKNNRKPRTT